MGNAQYQIVNNQLPDFFRCTLFYAILLTMYQQKCMFTEKVDVGELGHSPFLLPISGRDSKHAQ